jgi:Glycosyl transferase family 2
VSRRSPLAAARLPRVTVVIPCYNYGRYLGASVQSVLSQTGVDVEALIVNDASTDDSGEIARRLANRDARVSLVDHTSNIGHIATYNEGLSKAAGDYVALLSADDMLTPGSLARATAVMESRPQVGLVYGRPVVIFGDDVTPARTRAWGVRMWDGADWISAQCRRGLSCIYSPEVCVRASVQRTVGGYAPTLPHTGDLEMWLRIASVADVARVNSDQAYRRIHGAGMMQTAYDGLLADLRGRLDAYEAFFHGPGAKLERARQDLATARRRLAGEALDHACAQLRSGERASAEIAEYVAFAAELEKPEVSGMPQWSEYDLLRSTVKPSPRLRAVRLRYGAVRRDLQGRHRWYRWRLTGV